MLHKHVQALFRHLQGVDGELIVGNPTAHDVFQKTTSGVMSKEGEPDVTLYAFDMWNQTGSLLIVAAGFAAFMISLV